MARPSKRRRLLYPLLAVTGVALSCALVTGQELLRTSYHVAGDSKPVVLAADQVTSWVEGGRRVVVLRGKVLVEHGTLHARGQQAVVWVDIEQQKRSGVWQLEVYAEGDVALENGSDARAGPTARVDLSTRGEIKLRAKDGKVVQQTQREDALFRRAEAARTAPPPPQAPPNRPVRRGVSEEPTPPPAPSGPLSSAAPVPPDGSRPAQPTLTPARPTQGPPAQLQPPTISPLPTQPGPPAPPAAPPAPGPSSLAPRPSLLDAPPRTFSITPRTSAPYQQQSFSLPNGEQAVVFTGGVILHVEAAQKAGLVDIEADKLVVWTRGNTQEMLSNLRTQRGHTGREVEFYLAGNVEIRQQDGKQARTLRADEVFYDVSRNVAVAMNADLEFRQPGIPDPIHMKAGELLKLSETQYKAVRAELFASRLPSDPGLKVYLTEATLEERTEPKLTIFGRQFTSLTTGAPENTNEKRFRGSDVYFEFENVPFFYLPFVQGNANDPLGPLESVLFGNDRIFGTRIGATFDVYDLIGLDKIPNTRWRVYADYLSRRGPALGTEFDYRGKDLFGLPGRHDGVIKAFGIYDTATDILGGGRGPSENHPDFRGRFLWRNNSLDLFNNLTVQYQLAFLSDKNFLEQYYKFEFDNDINQETFLYLKQQRDQWAWTLLAEPRLRDWVTETEWLPRADGYLLGQSFFDLFTYNARASAGYAQLRPTDVPPPPVLITDRETSTGRFDLMQELSLPFTFGPLRLVPYGVLDLAYYTQDLTGDDRARVYGAGGLRGSIPFSRLYPEVQSELFNLNGIYHKIVLGGNYYAARSDTPFTRLPQLDRLDDDATDQARRDLRPLLPALNPTNGPFLATSPLFDPQRYAIRRLVDTRIDTLDTVEVVQADLRQRLQTKRGYPGQQHVVDWMTLDLSASFFPHPRRDASGTPWAFLEYDYTWNVGDRTTFVSTGWVDPVQDGARVFTVGAYLSRPDRTTFFVGYRDLQPVGSQAATGAVTYIFSPKYAMTAASTYDFGTRQSIANTLLLTRIGTDLQVSIGLTYNAILNNFGFTFEIVPNLVPVNRRVPGMLGLARAGLLGR